MDAVRVQVRLMMTCACGAPLEILVYVVGLDEAGVDAAIADARRTALPCGGTGCAPSSPVPFFLRSCIRAGLHLEAQAQLTTIHANDPEQFAAIMPEVWRLLDEGAVASGFGSPRVWRFMWSSWAEKMAFRAGTNGERT